MLRRLTKMLSLTEKMLLCSADSSKINCFNKKTLENEKIKAKINRLQQHKYTIYCTLLEKLT